MLRTIEDDNLEQIADAIRAKTKKTMLITIEEMPQEILDIETGGGEYALYAGKEEPTDASDGDYWVDTSDEGGSADDGYVLRLANGTLTADDKLPEGMTEIREYAFYNCKDLAITSLPRGIEVIQPHAFEGCTNLTSLVFEGEVSMMYSTSFRGCTNLTDIYVPFPELLFSDGFL